jgi:hypothetical protein
VDYEQPMPEHPGIRDLELHGTAAGGRDVNEEQNLLYDVEDNARAALEALDALLCDASARQFITGIDRANMSRVAGAMARILAEAALRRRAL